MICVALMSASSSKRGQSAAKKVAFDDSIPSTREHTASSLPRDRTDTEKGYKLRLSKRRPPCHGLVNVDKSRSSKRRTNWNWNEELDFYGFEKGDPSGLLTETFHQKRH